MSLVFISKTFFNFSCLILIRRMEIFYGTFIITTNEKFHLMEYLFHCPPYGPAIPFRYPVSLLLLHFFFVLPLHYNVDKFTVKFEAIPCIKRLRNSTPWQYPRRGNGNGNDNFRTSSLSFGLSNKSQHKHQFMIQILRGDYSKYQKKLAQR